MTANHESVYVVTGASSGIGRAVAKAIALRGLRVLAVARTKDDLDSLAHESHSWITAVPADLSTTAGFDKVASSVPKNSVVAGIVHSAASQIIPEPYQSTDMATLTEHFRVHVAAPITLFQTLAKDCHVDRMVFVDSYSASTARHGWAAYSIVKAAAQMSAICAAQELSQTDTIRVFPGAVKTRIVDTVMASNTEAARAFASMQERDEFAEPREVAAFIVNLLVEGSDELIKSKASWDYNDPSDRSQVGSL